MPDFIDAWVKTGFGEDLDIFTKMEGDGGQVERRDESVLFCGSRISSEQGMMDEVLKIRAEIPYDIPEEGMQLNM